MKLSVFFAYILLMIGIAACGSKNDDSAVPDTSSNINVFLAVQGKNYDVLLDTTEIGTNLGAGESTGYKSFTAKRYTLNIYPAGNRTTPAITGQISMRNDFHYSIFLSLDHNGNLRLLGATDVLTAPEAVHGGIRIVNLCDTYNSDASPVNLDFYTFDLTDTTRVQNLGYLGVTGFTSYAAGTFNRDIHYTDSSLSLLGKNSSSFTVLDGKLTSWIVYGNALVSDSFKLVEFVHN